MILTNQDLTLSRDVNLRYFYVFVSHIYSEEINKIGMHINTRKLKSIILPKVEKGSVSEVT